MSGHCAKSTFPFESVGVSKMFGAAKGDAAYARQASSPVMTYSNSSDNMEPWWFSWPWWPCFRIRVSW